jgi:superfamily II DNA/RNA helicase
LSLQVLIFAGSVEEGLGLRLFLELLGKLPCSGWPTHQFTCFANLKLQVLIFAGSVEEGLGLRLFLESFGLRLGCLHAELPVNSRSHILASFNKGLFDFLIAVGELVAEITS